METLVPFIFGKTCYVVARRGEWAFFVHVSDAGPSGIHIELDLTDPQVPNVTTPRRFTYPVGEGMALEVERLDGTPEEVTIWPDSVAGAQVMMGFELPGGAEMQPVDDRDDQAAG